MTAETIALIVGGAVAFVAWAVLDILFSEERRVSRRLKALSEAERMHAGEVEPTTLPFRQRVLKPVSRSTADAARRLMPRGYVDRLDRRTRMAGQNSGVDAYGMLALKVLSLIVCALLGAGFAFLLWGDPSRTLLAGALLAVLGWLLPDVWLNGQIARRKDRIRRDLPEMLDMLTIAVEAGLGFDAAVTKYIRNSSGPLAEEFSIELSEVQAGLSRREAMRKLADRVDVFELSTFCMAMVQADVFGVSVGNVLRTQSAEMRLKRRQYAEEIAQKIPAKMVFPLVLCILPATLIVLMTPAAISIMRIFSGGG
jgi:tight adherence protein C